MKIAIVGYGTAGQAAAIFLARDGHEVDMFEQSRELKPVGAGFLLQPTGLGVMAALGLRDAAIARGSRIERLHGVNAAGRRTGAAGPTVAARCVRIAVPSTRRGFNHPF